MRDVSHRSAIVSTDDLLATNAGAVGEWQDAFDDPGSVGSGCAKHW